MSDQQSPSFGRHRPVRPLASWKSHQRMVLAIFLPGVVLAAAAAILIPPLYRAEALVLVSPRQIRNLSENAEVRDRDYREYAQNQVYLLLSYEILRDGLLRLGDEALRWGDDERLRPLVLQEELKVEHINQTNIVSVALTDTSREGLAETVNAVVEAYLMRVRSENFVGKDQRVENLSRRRRDLQRDLRGLVARKAQLVERLGLLGMGEDLANPYQDSITYLNASQARARERRLVAEREVRSVERALQSVLEDRAGSIERQRLQEDPFLLALRNRLDERRVALQSQLSGLASDHRGRESIEQELRTIEKEYEKAKDEALGRIRAELEADIRQRLEMAQLELDDARKAEQDVDKELQGYRDQVASHTTQQNELLDLQADIERVRLQLQKIDYQFDEFATEENAPGSVRLASAARLPELPEHKWRVIVAVLIFGGFSVVAFSLPIVVDHVNPWVMNPRDVEAILRFPPVGWLLEKTSDSEAFVGEQIRSLAVEIQARFRDDGIRSFLLTSVKPGGGATTLTLALARQLVEMGLRPLVVEANAFRRDAAGDDDGPGLSDLLRGEARVEGVIRRTAGQPDRVPVGRSDERHLPERGRLAEIVLELGKDYDLVLVDSPPLLLSSDAELLARSVGATLLVVEAEGVTLQEVRRAGTQLARIRSTRSAVIVNRVRPYRGAGYFHDMLQEHRAGRKMEPKGLLARWLLGRRSSAA